MPPQDWPNILMQPRQHLYSTEYVTPAESPIGFLSHRRPGQAATGNDYLPQWDYHSGSQQSRSISTDSKTDQWHDWRLPSGEVKF